MALTLERLLEGAKLAKSRLSGIVSATARKAKRALSPVLNPLVLGATLLVPNVNAEVLLTMEARNLNNIPNRFWMPNAQTLKVFVYADNTSQAEATSGIEWELRAPPQLEYKGRTIPNPYIPIASSEPNTITNDFFNPALMDPQLNCVAHPSGQTNVSPAGKSSRFTARLNGSSQRCPVASKKGWIGIYYFQMPTNCPLGDYKFEIVAPRAESPNGEAQDARGTKMTIRVMKDVRSLYNSPTDQPMLLIDYNNGIPCVHVSHSWNQLQLEASSDLQNWNVLKVNDSQNSPGVKPYWLSFDVIDTSARYNPVRLYRARTVR